MSTVTLRGDDAKAFIEAKYGKGDVSSSQTSRHSSETNEHMTPLDIVELARVVLGAIALDPASTYNANESILATKIYTKEDNGYLRSWVASTIFLNPPGGWCDVDGRQVIKASGNTPGCTTTGACGLPPGHEHHDVDSSQKRWWQRLATAWSNGDVSTAIFICFSVELLQSSQVDRVGPLPLMFSICYPSRRVAYLNTAGKVGKSPPHASCIICLTDGVDVTSKFEDEFSRLGHVVVPRDRATR